jgi:hypothetical protein
MTRALMVVCFILGSGITAVSAQNSPARENSNALWKNEAEFREYQPTILKAIDWLEANPLAEEDRRKKMAALVMAWLTDVPYLRVHFDPGYIRKVVEDKKYPYASWMTVVFLMGVSKHCILHEQEEVDPVKSHTAGLISVLTVYERIKTENKKATQSHLEDLLKRRNDGALEDYVRSVTIQPEK